MVSGWNHGQQFTHRTRCNEHESSIDRETWMGCEDDGRPESRLVWADLFAAQVRFHLAFPSKSSSSSDIVFLNVPTRRTRHLSLTVSGVPSFYSQSPPRVVEEAVHRQSFKVMLISKFFALGVVDD